MKLFPKSNLEKSNLETFRVT